jgi:hypothetical protein
MSRRLARQLVPPINCSRIEHEDGLQEIINQQTVAFDQMPGTLSMPWPQDRPRWLVRLLKGGLIYAGVNGAPTQQGNPQKSRSPRVGLTYALDKNTVILAAGRAVLRAGTTPPASNG